MARGLHGGRARRRWIAAIGIVLFWACALVGAVLLGISLWVDRTFGPISYDQLLSNLGGGGEGAGGDGIVVDAVVSAILIPAAIVVVLAVLVEWGRRRLLRRAAPGRRQRILLVAVSVALAMAIPVAGAAQLSATVGIRDYVMAAIREQTTGTSLGDFYVAPETGLRTRVGTDQGETAHADGSRENLVLIYLESIEDTFADDELFEKNMLAPVQRSTRGWERVPALEQYEGGGWTMSGIVATQCGIPLRTASASTGAAELNDVGSQGELDDYLPGATCLGDVLADRGYRNVYLGGADARFAGKGAFLEAHGYDEVHDLTEWRAAGETELRPDWGLSDRRLFEHAKTEVTRLHEWGEPFNLTMLTLDTHERTFVHDYCDVDTENELTSATECSMRQVGGFIDYLDAQGILEDTTVVVMGDHLKMVAEVNNYYSELKSLPGRTIFNRIWSPEGKTVARERMDQFAMYPTMLELLDVELVDHRAGIGVSALVDADEVPPGSVLDLDDEAYASLVRAPGFAFYREMWDVEDAGGASRSVR